MKLTRNDYIALIVEHTVNQGYKSTDWFVNYITNILPDMTTEELAGELQVLEADMSDVCINNGSSFNTEVDTSGMPENYGLGCSWN